MQTPGKLIKKLLDQSFKHLLNFKPVASDKEGVCLHIYASLDDDPGSQYLLEGSPKFFHTLFIGFLL